MGKQSNSKPFLKGRCHMKSLKVSVVGTVVLVCVWSVQSKANYSIGRPENLGRPVNTGGTEAGAMVSSDGLTLYLFDDNLEYQDVSSNHHRGTLGTTRSPAPAD